jgi:hypothetical protein
MDQETIQKLALEIVRHLPSYTWSLLAIQLVLTLLAAGLGAFLGEYLRTRGKNLATKADFESLTGQLRANTELVETIKADVSQKDWAEREWTNLRRAKLEVLLDKMHECQSYLEHGREKALNGEAATERDPQPALKTIAALYFPELAREVGAYTLAYRENARASNALGLEILNAADAADRQLARDKYKSSFSKDYKKALLAQEGLTSAARNLLIEIMGITK